MEESQAGRTELQEMYSRRRDDMIFSEQGKIGLVL